jgi:Bacteriophage tail sheath protein
MASEPLDFVADAEQRPRDCGDAIPLTAVTVVAFIGRTERGPLNEPVPVGSYGEFRRIFGGHCAYSFVSFAVEHFFDNGGEVAVVVRVANRATRAMLALPAGEGVLRLQARHPGSREFLRVSIDYDRVEERAHRFNLVVQRLSRPGSHLIEDQELFEALSMEPEDDRFVVDALQDSELIRLVGPLPTLRPDATRAARPGEPIPYVDMGAPGTDGEELTDYDIIGSNSEGTGLFALDRCVDVDYVCIPLPPGQELGTTSFVAATRYCERRRALLIWDPPWSWHSPESALLSMRSSGRVSPNAVTYFPRLRSRSEFNRYPAGLPACGAVAGILASCERRGVWHGLLAEDAVLKANLAPLVQLSERQIAMLNRAGVNAFVRVPSGAELRGNVTFAGPTAVASLWQSLSTRRVAAFILRSIERHTLWVFEAARTADLAATLERRVWIFLSRLQQRGALAGKNADQAFFVRAGAVQPEGTDCALRLRVGFALKRPNEFLVYDFRFHGETTSTEVVPVLDADRYVG